MPELPEVEILARHLAPLLQGKTIRLVEARRARVIRPHTQAQLNRALKSARFTAVSRRGKYLLFQLQKPGGKPATLVGHLGMTGRMYLKAKDATPPKHAAVIIELGERKLIFEDTRYFGRLSLSTSAVEKLGPEPLGPDFTPDYLAKALARSTQAIKVKLLDQSLVAGIGNIYASEALFDARISPRTRAKDLNRSGLRRLRQGIREVLRRSIRFGSTVHLDFAGTRERDRLFYYGSSTGAKREYSERLLVYDRAGKSCPRCGSKIERFVQSARSTFFCPQCQEERRPRKPDSSSSSHRKSPQLQAKTS